MEKTTLQNFENTLEQRLQTLQNHINVANSSIHELNHQTCGDQADMISANAQGVLNLSILQQYEQELKEIQKSLYKIQNGIFGICEMCGDDIDVERLSVKPHARYCIICRELYEKTL